MPNKKSTLLTLSILLVLAGCAAPPPTYHNPPRVVLTDAQRNNSNKFPDPSKPDPMLEYYFSYSPDNTTQTRVGERVVRPVGSFSTQPQSAPYGGAYSGHAYGGHTYVGGYSVYGGGYNSYSHYNTGNQR